jgi:hypothetical protein
VRTRLAKIWWGTFGLLTRVRVYQHFYEVVWDSEPDEEPRFHTVKLPRSWTFWTRPLEWAFKAERIDPEHFEHWAYVHELPKGPRCTCGGWAE